MRAGTSGNEAIRRAKRAGKKWVFGAQITGKPREMKQSGARSALGKFGVFGTQKARKPWENETIRRAKRAAKFWGINEAFP